MIDKYTGYEIVSPADKLGEEKATISESIPSPLWPKASVFNTKPSSPVGSALRHGGPMEVGRKIVTKEIDIDALRRVIFTLPASKVMAVLAAVGVGESELKERESELHQTQELE